LKKGVYGAIKYVSQAQGLPEKTVFSKESRTVVHTENGMPEMTETAFECA